MKKIVRRFKTSFSIDTHNHNNMRHCGPLGENEITATIHQPHWWSSRRHITIEYTGYELQPMPSPPKGATDGSD